MKQKLTFTLNRHLVSLAVSPRARLLEVIREKLGQTGSKEGCGEGECGACTVIVDGEPVNACLYPALEAEGREVISIEGLLDAQGNLSDVQQAFVEEGGIQCGFCSPGMILSVQALLEDDPKPSRRKIRESLSGNLCRCTGYQQIIEAVEKLIKKREAVFSLGTGGSHE
jgi:carbon-monoxide dehydrogenase small subunit